MTSIKHIKKGAATSAGPTGSGAEPGEPATRQQLNYGPLPSHIGYILRCAQLRSFRQFHETLSGLELSPAQFSVLVIVGFNPGLKQAEVAAALNIKRANLVALLDRLERAGLAQRVVSTTDRRSHALYLTDAGMALMKRAEGLIAHHEKTVEDRLGAQNKRKLFELLVKLQDAMGPEE